MDYGYKAALLDERNGQLYPIMGERCTVGRSTACEIVLNDASISRVHVEIGHSGSGWYVVDHNSRNGTLVNGRKIPANVPVGIPDGAELAMGQNTKLRFAQLQKNEVGKNDEPRTEMLVGNRPTSNIIYATPSVNQKPGTSVATARNSGAYSATPATAPKSVTASAQVVSPAGPASTESVSDVTPAPPPTSAPTPNRQPARKNSRKKRKTGIAVAAVAAVLALAALGATFFLTEGFKSGQVLQLERSIKAIGEVTLDSGEQLQQARSVYDSLSVSDRDQVSNADELRSAEDRYQILLQADAFDQAVREFGVVNLDREKELSGLREQYEALPEEAKTTVTEETALTALEAQLQQLKYQDQAAKLDREIIDLGEVNLESGDAIRQVREEYSAAPPQVKERVTALGQLEEKEKAWAKLKEKSDYDSIQARIGERNWQAAIDEALAFLDRYNNSDYSQQVEESCLDAHHNLAKQFENQGLFASAEKSLMDCQALSLSVDEGRTQTALDQLRSRIEAKRPSNGSVLGGNCKGGYGKLIVSNGSKDALIKIENVSDPDKYLIMYVRANETASVHVVDGRYTFKYAVGDTWYGLEEMFGEETSYHKADSTVDFSTTYSGSYIYYGETTITLYSVLGGNLGMSDIDGSKF